MRERAREAENECEWVGGTQGKGESGKLAGTLHCTATDLPALPQKPPAPSFLSLCAPPVLPYHPPPNPLPCAAPLGCDCPLGSTRGGRGWAVFVVGGGCLTFSAFSLLSPFCSHSSTVQLDFDDNERTRQCASSDIKRKSLLQCDVWRSFRMSLYFLI